jgi:hypothetical protein
MIGSGTVARVTRQGNIYTAPGRDGDDVRPLVMGETFLVHKRREGRWADLYTEGGSHVGFTKAKRLSVGDGTKECVLTDFWGYVDPKYLKRPKRVPKLDRRVVEAREQVEVIDGQHRLNAMKDQDTDRVVESLDRLAEVVEQAEPELDEPNRSRFAFFDRFCALLENRRATGNDVNIAEARYALATTTVRATAFVGGIAYLVHGVLPLLG